MKPKLPITTIIIRSVDKLVCDWPHLKSRAEQHAANVPSLSGPWIYMQLGLASDDRRVLIDSKK